MKKHITLILCAILAFGMLATALGEQLDYLNYESARPIVKEGHEVKLTFGFRTSSLHTKPEGSLYFRMVEQLFGITPEFIPIDDAVMDEKFNLMFAANEIPDVMMDFPFSKSNDGGTDLIMRYGVEEGQLLALNDYITEELMPNVYALSQADPDFLAFATAPDGNIYNIPRKLDTVPSYDNPHIRVTWLNALGLESPTTLDEFLDTMRLFKEKDVDGHGSENVYPIGGCFDNQLNPFGLILNALGYNMEYTWTSAKWGSGLGIALRDGEATFPCSDDLYYEFLKIAKMCYDEQLISPDFFTMDASQVNAMAYEGVLGYLCWPLHVILTEPKDYQEWYMIAPLTSAWNEKAQTPSGPSYDMFSIFVSADTKYPEVCARFIDSYYGDDNLLLGIGPYYGTPEAELLGTPGWILRDDGSREFPVDMEGNGVNFYYGEWPGRFSFGRVETDFIKYTEQKAAGVEITENQKGWLEQYYEDYDHIEYGDDLGKWIGYGSAYMVWPHSEPGYPRTVFRTADTVAKIADYSAVIEPYVKEQFAMFVTGKRALNEEEFAKYLTELKAMGMDEYEQIFKDEYAAYLAH